MVRALFLGFSNFNLAHVHQLISCNLIHHIRPRFDLDGANRCDVSFPEKISQAGLGFLCRFIFALPAVQVGMHKIVDTDWACFTVMFHNKAFFNRSIAGGFVSLSNSIFLETSFASIR